MTTFTIRIKTLSASAPGSGEGRAGVIDRDITHDEQGLPFLGARRLKGLLRESACEVHEALVAFEEWRGKNLLTPDALFGQGGQAQAGPFRLEDAKLENHASLAEWLEYACSVHDGRRYFHSEAVLATYTELRSQTAMNAKTGGPQENSLRVTRLLRPGLVMLANGELDVPDDAWRDLALRTLGLACSNLRRGGMARNRGPGHLAVALECAELPSLQDDSSLSRLIQEWAAPEPKEAV